MIDRCYRRLLTVLLAGSVLCCAAAANPQSAAKRERGSRPPAAKVVASAPKADPAALVAPALQADVRGGYVSSYIVVRVKPGVQPGRDANGRWTFTAAHTAGTGGAQEPQPAAADLLADALARWRVIEIKPALTIPPRNAVLAQRIGLDRYYIIRVPIGTDAPRMAAEIAALNNLIESAQADSIGGIASVPNDPSFGLQWNMDNTGQSGGTFDADVDAPEAWDVTTGSSTIIIAVLDTGVQQANKKTGAVDHPELAGRVIGGMDFHVDPPTNDTSDLHGHGTRVAGIVAAKGNNSIGVAGMNWNAKILAVRIVDPISGTGTEAYVAAGVTWATDNGANIISMSLQYFTGTDLLRDAVAYAYDSGVLPIAASGNQGSPTIVAYPAKFPKCMAIGATTRNDLRAGFSNAGPELDVVAPGAQIYSTWKNSGYSSTPDGTSFATPHVSGLASLLLTRNPALTPPELEAIIKTTAEDRGPVGFDNEYGWGRINARAALDAVEPLCPADITGDGAVDVNDLLMMIGAWGICPVPPPDCPADIAPPPGGDGFVDVNDLVILIGGWGACP